MKPAHYKTETAAAKYAADLGAIFPGRQFKPICAGFVGFNVGVFNDGKLLALAGKRKRKQFGSKVNAGN